MAQRVSKSKVKGFFIDEGCHPQNIAVMKTRAAPLGIEITVGNPDDMDAQAIFGAISSIRAPMATCVTSPMTSPSSTTPKPSASSPLTLWH